MSKTKKKQPPVANIPPVRTMLEAFLESDGNGGLMIAIKGFQDQISAEKFMQSLMTMKGITGV